MDVSALHVSMCGNAEEAEVWVVFPLNTPYNDL